jgi:predicted DNA-binding transcriptional regulator AlpA
MPADGKTHGISPHRIYRKYAKETQEILGLGRSAIEEAIKNGDIPPPLPLTEHGSATGWLGEMLIEIQNKRIARAEQRAAARAPAAAEVNSSRRGRRRKAR